MILKTSWSLWRADLEPVWVYWPHSCGLFGTIASVQDKMNKWRLIAYLGKKHFSLECPGIVISLEVKIFRFIFYFSLVLHNILKLWKKLNITKLCNFYMSFTVVERNVHLFLKRYSNCIRVEDLFYKSTILNRRTN